MGVRRITVSLTLASVVASFSPLSAQTIAPSGWEEENAVAATSVAPEQPTSQKAEDQPAESIYEHNMQLLGIPREQWHPPEAEDTRPMAAGTESIDPGVYRPQPQPFAQRLPFSPGSWLIDKLFSGSQSTLGATAGLGRHAMEKARDGVSSPTGQALLQAAIIGGALAGTGALAWSLSRNSGGSSDTNPNIQLVDGYTRADGRHVDSYFKTRADNTMGNNFSTIGNMNPFTGRPGYVVPTH